MIFLYEFFMVVLLKKVNIEFVVEKNFSIVFGVKVFGDQLLSNFFWKKLVVVYYNYNRYFIFEEVKFGIF